MKVPKTNERTEKVKFMTAKSSSTLSNESLRTAFNVQRKIRQNWKQSARCCHNI